MVDKKKTDYTNSAVNLCNPPQLQSLLIDLALLRGAEAILQTELEKTPVFSSLKAKQGEITFLSTTIREAIDAHGSFQDLDTGTYALKQRKISITYIASKVREFLRTYADAVIEEVVSKSKLEGLRKGGLVSQADLDRCADTTESFAYIIKADQGE